MRITNRHQFLAHATGDARAARDDALRCLEAALRAADPYRATRRALHRNGETVVVDDNSYFLSRYQHIYLIGFGKASLGMARAARQVFPVDKGAVITTERATLEGLSVYTGTHPLPSARNVEATRHLLDLVKEAGPGDLLVTLVSGGGSALLCQPRISLEAMQTLTRELINAGCTIQELNAVRRHLSTVKGGQLAAMSRAPVLSLIISDVIGDPLSSIASGPTAPDPTSFAHARQVLERYGLWDAHPDVCQVISAGEAGDISDTPSRLDHVHNVIVARNRQACQAACTTAEERGYDARVVTTELSGEAREAGRDVAHFARVSPRERAAYIFGGETTVTVTGGGEGGRNQELVLAAVPEMEGERMVLLSCGTDGIDGASPAAGAMADGRSLQRARELRLDPLDYLRRNDSHTFFKKMDDALFTGPTGTNVMDVVIALRY
ncbi:MAG: DUF4147 domain-containing protein [Candidatus Thermoplasmatota archaeon]|nr:DUF4147 domain-containing protein [Candidatus Thermoplasmatota archaeon]